MAKKQPAPRRVTPTAAPVKATQRPRAKVKPQIRAQGDKQVTAADIPGTSQHAQRHIRRQTAREEVTAPRRKGIRVRALQPGYYGHSRRREGDVFTIRTEAEFSKRWMERVDDRTRESITTPNEVIRKKHDETLALKYGARAGHSADDPAGDEEVEDDDDNPLGAD